VFVIQRYNGNNWDDGYSDKYGSYSEYSKAFGHYLDWQYEQPTSAWRLIVRQTIETMIDQSEPE